MASGDHSWSRRQIPSGRRRERTISAIEIMDCVRSAGSIGMALDGHELRGARRLTHIISDLVCTRPAIPLIDPHVSPHARLWARRPEIVLRGDCREMICGRNGAGAGWMG